MPPMKEPPTPTREEVMDRIVEHLSEMPPYFRGLFQGYCDCLLAEGYTDDPNKPGQYNERVFGYLQASVEAIPKEAWDNTVRGTPPGYSTFAESEIHELLDHIIHLFSYWGYDIANKSKAKGHQLYLKERSELIEEALKMTHSIHWGSASYRLICENGKYFITAMDDPLWKDHYAGKGINGTKPYRIKP